MGQKQKTEKNTPGTRGGPLVLDISSSYANILRETNFQLREIPQSGSKAKDGEEREKERLKIGNNNGQLLIANATSGGACKPPYCALF